MAFVERAPPPELSRFVDAFWVLSQPRGGATTIVPDGCVEAVVTVEGRFRLAGEAAREMRRTRLLGLATHPLRARYEGPVRLAGIRLTPAGALRLLGSVADGTLAPPLEDAAEAFARTGSVEDLCRELRPRILGGPAHPRLERALEVVRAGAQDVGALARGAGVSTRQLDRWFERHLGLPPKLLARIARFRSAFELGARGPVCWAAIAARCGYADQAHLSREFAEFCGQAPARLRASFADV